MCVIIGSDKPDTVGSFMQSKTIQTIIEKEVSKRLGVHVFFDQPEIPALQVQFTLLACGALTRYLDNLTLSTNCDPNNYVTLKDLKSKNKS